MPGVDLLTLREVAQMLNVREGTLRQWRNRRQGPPSHKIGVSVVYLRSDIEAWMRDRDEQATA